MVKLKKIAEGLQERAVWWYLNFRKCVLSARWAVAEWSRGTGMAPM